MAHLEYGRHATRRRRHLGMSRIDGGAKRVWQKLKFVTSVSRPHINSATTSTQRPHVMQGEMRQHHQLEYYGKQWYCDTTRRSDIGILTRACPSPGVRQLISREARALTRSTTRKVRKHGTNTKKVFRSIFLFEVRGLDTKDNCLREACQRKV